MPVLIGYDAGMSAAELSVGRRDYSPDDPWRLPPGVASAALLGAVTGSPPRLRTEVCAYRDDSRLYILFGGEDDHIVASHRMRDAALWEEDVVEVFLAPLRLEQYFEIEINPLGTVFDAIVHSPNGNRETMTVDKSWDCEGLLTAIRRTRRGGTTWVETLVALPFLSLGVPQPSPLSRWRANFFRIDRSPAGDDYLAWNPTRRNPPDFHVPGAFGTLVFE